MDDIPTPLGHEHGFPMGREPNKISAVGKTSSKSWKRKTEDTEIASSIRNAMSQLRADSLPVALVRPGNVDTEDSDLQVQLHTFHSLLPFTLLPPAH